MASTTFVDFTTPIVASWSNDVNTVAYAVGSTAGKPLVSNGSGVVPTHQTLGVSGGGTGVTTLTGLVKASGTTPFTAATAGTDYSVGTSTLTTGILKSTTGTGVLSIATAAVDYAAAGPLGSSGITGAAASGANSDITSLSGLTGAVSGPTSITGAATGVTLDKVTSVNGGPLAGTHNFIINGGCRIAQRGSTAAVNGAFTYGGVDRIFCLPNGFTTATGNITQIAFTGSTYGLGQSIGLTSTGSGTLFFGTRIESKDTVGLNNKTITIKAIVQQNTGGTINCTPRLDKATVVDTWPASATILSGPTVSVPSATPTPVSMTLTLSSPDGNTGLQVLFGFAVGAVTGINFTISDIQLEIGSVSTQFEQRPIGTEQKLCRRYCRVANFFVPATTAQNLGVIDMRATPTITGGGAGFTSTGTTSDTLIAFQTTGAVQTLTLSAEL